MPRQKKSPSEGQPAMTMTADDLLRSGLIGIWKGRADIRGSLAFARRLRERAWKSGKMPRGPR